MVKKIKKYLENIGRIITNTLNTIKQNKKLTIISALIFSLIYLFATGATNRYIYIPDWAPYKPTIFTPADENFETYALVWRFSENWLFSVNMYHLTSFIIITFLFAANIALLLNFWKNKKPHLKETATGLSGIFVSFFAVFTCCAPALAIALFGASIVFALEPYSEFIEGLAIILLTLNIILLNKNVKKIKKRQEFSFKYGKIEV